MIDDFDGALEMESLNSVICLEALLFINQMCSRSVIDPERAETRKHSFFFSLVAALVFLR